MLASGAAINSADKSGRGIAHVAAKMGNTDVLEYLLEKKQDLNVPDKQGSTPLLAALSEKQLDTANFLVENKIGLRYQVVEKSRPMQGDGLVHG